MGPRFRIEPVIGRLLGPISLSPEKASTPFGDPAPVFHDMASQGDPDLGFVLGVLTTEGGNNNGQHFFREELAKSYRTPILKPFNDEHDKNRIRGVIYDSALASQENHTPIKPDEFQIAETGEIIIPDEFGEIEVLIACAVYKKLFPEFYEKLMAAFAEGQEPRMSMEVWYTNYDFVVGGQRIQRAQGTEYLKDHIGKTMGGKRVEVGFMNMTFGGVARTEKPAQPKSVMLAVATNAAIAGDPVLADRIMATQTTGSFSTGDHVHTDRNPFGYHPHSEEEMELLWPQGEDAPRYSDKALMDKLGGHEHDRSNPVGLHQHSTDSTPAGPHGHFDSVDSIVWGAHSHPLKVQYASEGGSEEQEESGEIPERAVQMAVEKAADLIIEHSREIGEDEFLDGLDEEDMIGLAEAYAVQAVGEIHRRKDVPNPKSNYPGVKKFADPKNRKYPLDTEKHIRAAITYFSRPSNQKKYKPAERKAIWRKIISAAKKAGIKLSDQVLKRARSSVPEAVEACLELQEERGVDAVAEKAADTQEKKEEAKASEEKEEQKTGTSEKSGEEQEEKASKPESEAQEKKTDSEGKESEGEEEASLKDLEEKVAELEKTNAELLGKVEAANAERDTAKGELKTLQDEIAMEKRTAQRMKDLEDSGFTFRDEDHRAKTAELITSMEDSAFATFKDVSCGEKAEAEAEAKKEETKPDEEEAEAEEDDVTTGRAVASLGEDGSGEKKTGAKIKGHGRHRSPLPD